MAAGVLAPAAIALALLDSPLLTALSAAGALVVEMLCVVVWMDQRAERKLLGRRLRLVATPLSGEAPADGRGPVEMSVFRQRRPKSWLLDRIEQRFSMLDARKVLPKAVGLGGVAAVAAGVGAAYAGLGWLAALAAAAAWVAAGWVVLTMQDAGRRTEFLKQFPEATDHIVRLMRAGLPSVEAMSVVAEEAQPPLSDVMREVSERVSAGLDPETVLRGTALRIRIPEFTLFSAAVCLQLTTGGGISGALGNLSATLRARRETKLKAQSSTAQTRLTLLVLLLVPVAVVCAQSFTNPQAVDTLFNTDSGQTLLRYGIGCIIVGLLAARSMAARVGR